MAFFGARGNVKTQRLSTIFFKVLFLFPLVVTGYSPRYAERQKFSIGRALTSCYGITQDNYFYDFMAYHGKVITAFSNVINKTAIIEFCFSVSAMSGKSRYDPVTKKFSKPDESVTTSVGHSFGYFSHFDAARENEKPVNFISYYKHGDSGAPCFGDAARVAQVKLTCVDTNSRFCPNTKYSTANCTQQEWEQNGACICGLSSNSMCSDRICQHHMQQRS